MKIFLDTAEIAEIREGAASGLVDGVTTNPSLAAKTGRDYVEVLKEILSLGESLAGKLLIYDALSTRFRTVRMRPDPACPLCGPNAVIRDLTGPVTA